MNNLHITSQKHKCHYFDNVTWVHLWKSKILPGQRQRGIIEGSNRLGRTR